MKKHWKTYLISVLIPLGVGGLSALLTRGNMDIYKQVATPPLSPPSWLFPVVWTLLYILMGISSARVYLDRTDNRSRHHGLLSYGVSLFMNFLWSIIFFNMRSFLFAFVWLLGMLFFILRTVYYYSKVDKSAAKLQIPYIIWVSFAGYLTLGVYLLNR
ncbi:MAG: tryptophan-rich sensory protein [Clostridia bacterium]|nr:tryptophan-rich sensory protein [Clostridia bacterium]